MFFQIQPYDYTHHLPLYFLHVYYDHLQEGVYRAAGPGYYRWFFCTQGTGELIVNHQLQMIRQGMGFLLQPEEAHGYYGTSPDWTVHMIAFNGSLCGGLLTQLGLTESGSYYFTEIHLFERFISKIAEIENSDHLEKGVLLSEICYSFLLEIARCVTKTHLNPVSEKNMLVIKITEFLEEHFALPVSLDELALLVNLSKDYMCALFKKATGQTIIDYLTDLRLEHACQMLRQYPERTAAQVGRMCGFASPSYFGKVFKKYRGMTPNDYRRKK
ncbi:AraC family transcriptional regulator [Catenibacillus scindens]|uniref:AraC family transcriptional regulator n=1 Tax=Catenibacillus scindens TaxID=673271 RepID=UPI0032095B5B